MISPCLLVPYQDGAFCLVFGYLSKEALELARVMVMKIWQNKNKEVAELRVDHEREISDIEKQIDEIC
jgi:hypothetical protein